MKSGGKYVGWLVVVGLVLLIGFWPKPESTNDTLDKISIWRLGSDSWQLFELDIATGEAVARPASPRPHIDEYQGLPQETQTDQTESRLERSLISNDGSKEVVFLRVYDKTAPPDFFAGLLPLLREEEFLCTTATKTCVVSTLLSASAQLVGNVNIWWTHWDTTKNLLIGHGNNKHFDAPPSSPVVVVNLQESTFQKTGGYDFGGKKRAILPDKYVSPSLTKFALLDYDERKLLLYSTSDTSSPIASLDIPEGFRHTYSRDVGRARWNHKEDKLILGTHEKIYLFNLDTHQSSLLFEDKTRGENRLYWSSPTFSAEDRFFYIVDWVGAPRGLAGDEPGTSNYIVKSIDLEHGNRIRTLLSGNDAEFSPP